MFQTQLDTNVETVLWIGAALIAVMLLLFLYLLDTTKVKDTFFHIIMAFIALISASGYFAMATGYGSIQIGDHPFFFARFTGMLITTPLVLLVLIRLGMPRTNTQSNILLATLGTGLYMIITLLISGMISTTYRFAWFTAGCVAFLAIVYMLLSIVSAEAQNANQGISTLYKKLLSLFIISWTAGLLVYLLSPDGFNIFMSAGTLFEVVLYVLLDVVTIGGFGFLLLTQTETLYQRNNPIIQPISSPIDGEMEKTQIIVPESN